jgi:hypothetical protein
MTLAPAASISPKRAATSIPLHTRLPTVTVRVNGKDKLWRQYATNHTYFMDPCAHVAPSGSATKEEAFPPRHPLCHRLATTTVSDEAQGTLVPSGMSLWLYHLDEIHRASSLRNDKGRQFLEGNMTTQLWEWISPRLPLSVNMVRRDWTTGVV